METTEKRSAVEMQSCGSSNQSPIETFDFANRELLQREVARFDPSVPVQEAWLPPSSWYTAPEIYRLEQHTVFKNNWLIAARRDQLGAPGQYVSGNIAGEPYVIVRLASAELKAFYNVCRHHAAEVAPGNGCVEKFQCPYHGWTYALDGGLLSAPGLGAVKDFDREHFGLVPMHVREWGGLVFLCRGENPTDLNDDLSQLKRALDETKFENLTFVERRIYQLNCNWKVFIDNYLDGGYHVQHLHKGLAGQLDLTTYTTDLFDRFSIQATAGKSSETSKVTPPDVAGEDFKERLGDRALYAWLYPNLMINRYGSIMDTNWVLPLAHDRTLVIIDFYFENTDGAQAQEFITKSIAASDVVQNEDVDISESVQRGLWSSSYDKGRYGKLELGEHHFHSLLAKDFHTFFCG
jgi:choline monooxygenase